VIARLIATWAFNVAALFVADALIDGISFDDAWKVVVAGAVFGVVMMSTDRASRRMEVPFGPFLALGTLVAIFWGQQFVDLVFAR